MSMHLWSVESLLADIKKMASDDLYNCKLFTVEKDGKSLKLKERQLTTSVLARVFCLFPETIILVSDDGYVEIPDEDGCFNSVDDLPVWTVTGDSMNPTSAAPPTAMMTPFAYQPPRAAGRKTRARKWAPIYRTSLFQQQKPPGVRAQESSDYVGTSSGSRSVQPSASEPTIWRKYIEICKWSEREKQWKKVSNLPLTLSESTANIQSVTEMVAADAFNGEAAVILDNEYLQIPDTPNTMGKQDFLV